VTSLKRLSSDDADVILGKIAQSIGESRKQRFELPDAEWPTDSKNDLKEMSDGVGTN
jgi:hypothetical protein